MFDFTEYIEILWLFDFSNSWWDVKIIKFTEYIDFFLTFCLSDLLLRGQTDRFYWISRFFLSFRLFKLGGGRGRLYWPGGGEFMVRVLISRKNQACKNEGVDRSFNPENRRLALPNNLEIQRIADWLCRAIWKLLI